MKPKVIIEEEVYRKIMYWVNKSEYEVSGLGTLKVEDGGVLRVTGAMLLPQKNGRAHTDIEADAICKALFELRDVEGEVRFWWHSHVKMGVFWSSTDHQAMRDFASTPGSWMLSTVFNQKRELRSAYYAHDGIDSPWGKTPLFYDELDTKIEEAKDEKEALWEAEYVKNVQNVNPMATRFWDAQAGQWLPEEGQEEKGQAAVALDDFGFDSQDWVVLASAGYNNKHIEDLIDRDFNPSQILVLAEAGFSFSEVISLLDDADYTNHEILNSAKACVSYMDGKNVDASDDAPEIEDDLPVADRRHAWESEGGYML